MILLKSEKHKVSPIVSDLNFLTEQQCDDIIKLSKKFYLRSGGIGDAKSENNLNIKGDYQKKIFQQDYSPGIRKSEIRWFDLDDSTSWIYEKLIKTINRINFENYGMSLKYIETMQFTEYSGLHESYYREHNDCGNIHDQSNFVDIRKLSFSIQLSEEDSYKGGELEITNWDESIFVVPKQKGSITFFLSDMNHQVKPVTKGIRYSLVGWVNGPNIK
ncbi:hypothetical protein CMO86_09265 [Candidatus Woesearchaeota archaeon]|jgi:PKHD-type hydroxylase|nr:hypothetical protein [Candidatus Woesearchaeota archaeon]|tara:strand:- start:107 stop:757 length:651 start_codon:yes stop_codon:yes gene_type:complete